MSQKTAFTARAARVARASLCGVAALFFAASGAAKATVTDVSGQTYNVESMRLAKGSKLTVDCGGARLELPVKNIKSIKIDPKKISSIDGRLHFGVELLLNDSTAVGGGKPCSIPADNGVAGKVSKGKFSLPFEKLRHVYILGKEDIDKKQPAQKGGAAEQPQGEDNVAEQPEKEDDGESAPEKE